jgi:maltooligosyltrehalose trehalohydrolase
VSSTSHPKPLGATFDGGETTFRVWTTRASRVGVRWFDRAGKALETRALDARGGGQFEARVRDAPPGTLYKFVLDDDEVPDPYARALPLGVHGPAEVVARRTAPALERRLTLDAAPTYELHVGTFTPEGSFAAAAERLPSVAALGVGAIELMPVAAFAGARGWGYDGVAHYAPHAPYGRPEDLRQLVARAHALGMGVLLDVVYNHFGPSGNYLARYAPEYFTSLHKTPWGDAPNFTHPRMREHVLGSARMWLEEYGFDGLRLDATHSIVDGSPRHILRDLADLASAQRPARVVVAEDERNDSDLVRVQGVDAVWADDFHHTIRALLAGDRDGYYAAYEPTLGALARVIERGWAYEGQPYAPWGKPRGTPADAMRFEELVFCIENHDQSGNRAFGERLSNDVSLEQFAAATALLLFLPMSPLLFMGQEWGASSPFLYFTDHDQELGALVTKGRREEFKAFRSFADAEARARIPDPQSPDTFQRSKLRWAERERAEHQVVLRTATQMIDLRRSDAVLRERCARGALRARAEGEALVVERRGAAGERVLVANFTKRALPLEASAYGRPLVSTHAWDGGALPAEFAVVLAR